MPKILKTFGVRTEPVRVEDQRRRAFNPTRFQSLTEENVLPQEEVETQLSALEEAQSRVAEILAEAEAKAENIAREAMAQGYADGRSEGLRAVEEQCREHLDRIGELARRAMIDRRAMIRSAEQELVTLAIEIAAKVIRREVETDPSIVLAMVESGLEKVGSAEAVRILVHSSDAEIVREKWTEIRGAVAFGSNWEVVGDDQMERGGCVIETRSGVVDSRVETQLSEIGNVFEVGT